MEAEERGRSSGLSPMLLMARGEILCLLVCFFPLEAGGESPPFSLGDILGDDIGDSKSGGRDMDLGMWDFMSFIFRVKSFQASC